MRRRSADGLVHGGASEVSALVSVYALVNEMRVLSSSVVVERALQTVAQVIIGTYFAPNKTFPELRELLSAQAFDPLRLQRGMPRRIAAAQRSLSARNRAVKRRGGSDVFMLASLR
jgi:hypothetical protein